MTNKKTLIMIDLQNDFCPGGSLAVTGGDEVMSVANQLQAYFEHIIATLDWHPADHVSFAANHAERAVGDLVDVMQVQQMLWPVHCVQYSQGADFHPQLNLDKIERIFYKGTDKHIDSYSAFFDNAHLRSTGLAEYLCEQQINDVYIMGLATDYCVKYSALDAIKQGLKVTVIKDACRAVEWRPGDAEKAFAEMQAAGVRLINVADIVAANQ